MPVCRRFSRAYVRHLLNVGEILGVRLLTVHNLHRYMAFMREIREAIRVGDLDGYRKRVKERLSHDAHGGAAEYGD